ncbi:MAG: trigger factor [Chitinophagales bacterium]|nr:trigger factor [Chitinophagales bacterium]
MKVTTESLGELHSIINITIEDNDYRDRYDKQMKDLGKKIQLPGFRPGKVPASLVKQRFGESVLAEELNKIVNEQVGNYLKENNLQILGEAIPVREEPLELKSDELREYTFSYEAGFQPAIDVRAKLNKDKTFTRYRIAATEEEIQNELLRLQKRYGNREDVETAEEGDIIYAHLHELNDDGTEKEGGVHAHSFFNLEMLNEEGQKIFTGVSKDHQQNIDDIFSVFKGDKENIAKNILMLEDTNEELLQAIKPKFEVKVDRIARLFPAEINDKFFNEIVKEYGEVENEEELRNKIKDTIENYNNRSTEVTLENDIFNYLHTAADIQLPTVFLHKWYRRSLEAAISDEEYEKQFETFLTRLKQSLVFQKIQKEHGIDVKNEEVVHEAYNTVQSSYGHLGGELVEYIAKNNLQNKEFIESMHDRIMQKKFFEVLKEYVTLEDHPITLEEFKNLNKEVYAE